MFRTLSYICHSGCASREDIFLVVEIPSNVLCDNQLGWLGPAFDMPIAWIPRSLLSVAAGYEGRS